MKGKNNFVSENSYDTNGRLFRTETTRNNQTITEDYGFDTFGRITSVKTTDPVNSSRYRVKFYNTGGQVIWESDEESEAVRIQIPTPLAFETGNQKYYTYNAFGDLEKTVYVMTESGKGLGSPDINPWLNSGQITTNFTYDIFGRITSRINDRSGVTEYNYYDTNAASSHRRNKLESIQITPALTDNDTGYQDSDSSTQTYTYTYDEYGDEASVEYTEGNNYSLEVSFTRDGYGRITGKTSNGSVPVNQTFTYNNWNQLANHTINNANADIYDMTYGYSRGWHLIEKADGIKHTSDKYSYDWYYSQKGGHENEPFGR